jgi:tetratricopeptide (TPR) repeat protein
MMRRYLSILFFLFYGCLAAFSQGDSQIHADQPYDLHAKKMLAKSLLNAGNADSAFILYKEIIELYPEDYDSFVFLGNYYYVIAKKFAKTGMSLDEKRSRFSIFRREDGKITPDTITKCYHKAGECLEKAYMIYNSDEIRKSLIEIYTIVGDKDKIAVYKKAATK